jgi:hypothetical protein
MIAGSSAPGGRGGGLLVMSEEAGLMGLVGIAKERGISNWRPAPSPSGGPACAADWLPRLDMWPRSRPELQRRGAWGAGCRLLFLRRGVMRACVRAVQLFCWGAAANGIAVLRVVARRRRPSLSALARSFAALPHHTPRRLCQCCVIHRVVWPIAPAPAQLTRWLLFAPPPLWFVFSIMHAAGSERAQFR